MYEWRPDRRSACSFFYVKLKKNNAQTKTQKTKEGGWFDSKSVKFRRGDSKKSLLSSSRVGMQKKWRKQEDLVFHGFVSGGDGFKSSSRLDDDDSEDAFGGDIHDGVQASFH